MSAVSRGVRQAAVAVTSALLGVVACEFSTTTGAPGVADEGTATTVADSTGGGATLDGGILDGAPGASSGAGDAATSSGEAGVAHDTSSGALDTTAGEGSSSTSSAAVDTGDTGETTSGSTTGDGLVTTLYCGSPGVGIPDDDMGGVATQILVSEAHVVLDVRVQLDITHTRVGDLRLDLRHGEADRLLVSYPGGGGCTGDDIFARLTDDATIAVSAACTGDSPAIAGDVAPEYSLDAFVGLSTLGTWELRATDGGPGETGSIGAWCLEIDHLP